MEKLKKDQKEELEKFFISVDPKDMKEIKS